MSGEMIVTGGTLGSGKYYGRVARRRDVGGLLLTETRYSAGARVPRHAHENPYVCFVHHGGYAEIFNGRPRTCGPLTLALHPAGEVHAERFDTECRSLNIEMLPSWVDRFDAHGSWLRVPVAVHGGWPSAVGDRLMRELSERDAASELAIEGLFLELVATLARATASGRRPRWLDDVRDRLDADCQSRIDLPAVARDVGVHPIHVAATFRRHFHCSIGQYVRQRRIEQACRLIAGSTQSLAAIAAACGFADQSHFGRTFKQHLGISPGAYRRDLRGIPEPFGSSRHRPAESTD